MLFLVVSALVESLHSASLKISKNRNSLPRYHIVWEFSALGTPLRLFSGSKINIRGSTSLISVQNCFCLPSSTTNKMRETKKLALLSFSSTPYIKLTDPNGIPVKEITLLRKGIRNQEYWKAMENFPKVATGG